MSSAEEPKRWALITGGTRGIGAAIASALAEDGYPLLLTYRSNDEAANTFADAMREKGHEVRLLKFDVADHAAATAAIEGLVEEGLIVEVLVNNAGIARDSSFPQMSHDDWQAVTRTTLDGFYNVTRPLVMPMCRRRRGRIINISSVSGVNGNRGQANYAAAKAGLIGATKSLAIEVAKRGITVNAVAPGLIETDMIEDAPVDMIIKHIPMRRIGKPAEVASLVRYLASDLAGYITGQVIVMSGGL